MKNLRRVGFAASIILAATCGTVLASDADRTMIDQLRTSYVAAYNAGDSAAMSDFYVRDAVRMPYDATEQEGRKAIVDTYRSSFARRQFAPTLRLIAADVRISGDLALERGNYVEVLKPKKTGRKTLVERGKYVSLLEKSEDGKWRYAWSIFNRDAPPAPQS